jgi:hypothetical protein
MTDIAASPIRVSPINRPLSHAPRYFPVVIYLDCTGIRGVAIQLVKLDQLRRACGRLPLLALSPPPD